MPFPLTSPVLINQGAQAGAQTNALSAKLTNGGYVTVWQDNIGGGSLDVKFALFGADGVAGVTGSVPVLTAGSETLADVVAMPGGGFTVAWLSTNSTFTNSTSPLIARSFDNNGAATSGEIALISTAAPAHVTTSAQLIATGATTYKAFWTDEAGGAVTIRSATATTTGSPSGATDVASALAAGVVLKDVAPGNLAGNQLVVTSEATNNAFFSDNVASKTTVAAEFTEIVKVQPGLYVMTGEQGEELELRGLAGTGNSASAYTQTSVFANLLNSGATGTDVFDVTAADLGDGRVLVAWAADTDTSIGGTANPDAIYATVYNVNTNAFDDETQIDFLGTAPTNVRIDAEVLVDGRVALSWNRTNGLAGEDVFTRIIDPRIAGVTLIGTASDDKFFGTGFVDSLLGNAGADTLVAGGGDDFLNGGDGADLLDGGAGNDVVLYTDAAAAIKVDLQNLALNQGEAALDTLIGIENVQGTNFADQLFGDANANTLIGLDGADILAGRGGNDVLNGNNGDDVLNGGAGNDELRGLADNDGLAGGAGADLLEGGDGDDLISGGADADTILGGAGADRIAGGDGDDEIDGGSENDVVTGNAGNDSIIGGDGNDILSGGDGDDIINGGAGNDLIKGGAGSDVIVGGDGIDTLTFTDQLSIAGGGFFVDLDGTSSPDGGIAEDSSLSGIENVTGSAGNDALFGTNFVNVLRGGAGDDLLAGRGGNDTLIGGGGADAFRFEASNHGNDRVKDFEVGGDTIEIRGSGFADVTQDTFAFVANATGTATIAGAQFCFDNAGAGAGRLFFDADGTGAGATVLFATIQFADAGGLATFSASDFDILA